jgi:hypothetical protein
VPHVFPSLAAVSALTVWHETHAAAMGMVAGQLLASDANDSLTAEQLYNLASWHAIDGKVSTTLSRPVAPAAGCSCGREQKVLAVAP